jgi:hypothetical protein
MAFMPINLHGKHYTKEEDGHQGLTILDRENRLRLSLMLSSKAEPGSTDSVRLQWARMCRRRGEMPSLQTILYYSFCEQHN